MPNYVDDVEDFEQFDEEDAGGSYAANQANGYGEEYEHEIEGVYYHIRDEGREWETEDLWHDNIVSGLYKRIAFPLLMFFYSAIPCKVERIFAFAQHRRDVRVLEAI